jgi:adenylate cyclase
VRAAIALQRAIHDLNQQRQAENERRLRQAGSSAPSTGYALSSAPLPILTFGTGVNTGFATAGLMGSAEAESLNYTVFGREVNLASRLEGASGHSRIFIGPATYEHLRRDEPGLAEVCVPLPPLQLKGFASALSVYEVRWRPPGDPCGTVQDVQAVGKA